MSENEIKKAVEEGGRMAGVFKSATAIAAALGFYSVGTMVYTFTTGNLAPTADEVTLAVRTEIIAASENVRKALDEEDKDHGPMPYESDPATTGSITETTTPGSGDYPGTDGPDDDEFYGSLS